MKIGLVSCVVVAALCAGCGGGSSQSKTGIPVALSNCPDWVFRGGGAMEDGGKRAFYGVGAVRGIKNRSLAITTAENRARAEIARTIQTYSASLMKDYMASTSAGGDASSEEQHVEQAIKTFAAATLTGVTINDRWFAPDGTIYALARIDFEKVKESMAKTDQFNEQQRAYAQQKADEQYQKVEEPPPAPPPAPPTPETCVLAVRVIQVGRSSEGCYVDEKISGTVGTLTYPCGGGDAKADFGSVSFTGTVDPNDGSVQLLLKTVYEYPAIDHCKWESLQHILGKLNDGKLRYDYSEAPLPDQSDCAQPCTADGDVLLRQ